MPTSEVLNAVQIEQVIGNMAAHICSDLPNEPHAIVGIKRGGDQLAARIVRAVEQRTGERIPYGSVDITLYRDDGFAPGDWPEVGVTEIPFDIGQYVIVLIDDVLYTGRTVRAAIDVLLDYGRPKAIRLAVLVDRGLHEFPIKADWVGHTLETTPSQHVDVCLNQHNTGQDAVMLTAIQPDP